MMQAEPLDALHSKRLEVNQGLKLFFLPRTTISAYLESLVMFHCVDVVQMLKGNILPFSTKRGWTR